MNKINIFWFRRDLRLFDNHGLWAALSSGISVVPIFIFDTDILDSIENKNDARVEFIHNSLKNIKTILNNHQSDLLVFHGKPLKIFQKLIQDYEIQTVYCNHDYEPTAIMRDESVRELLNANGINFLTFKDHVIFEKDEIVKNDGTPYTVFTPYSKKWKEKWNEAKNYSYPSETFMNCYAKMSLTALPDLSFFGFNESKIAIPSIVVSQKTIINYKAQRDYPAINGTSKLGIHFRFGTISIRQKAKSAALLSETFLNELIWRDFYAQILYHFPSVVKHAFKKEYDNIEWENNEENFQKWCDGHTGYPLVDAGMRELNETGYMHNRVRMITASFLTKHLLIDWRWGEAYFAAKLLDFDLSSNNGGWQWAAGCGTDAAPYFRIFNPIAQQEKFDKNFEYIKKWVPEFGTIKYPQPIVDHSFARERCLKAYKKALDQK